MELPDDIITRTRQAMYQKGKCNFDDICFTFFRCPICGKEKIDMTLLPLVNTEHLSEIEIRNTHAQILAQIFDADFDFLHEKGNCDCRLKPTLELRRIIYCFNQGYNDIHNYIDYPFEQIKKFQINLTKINNNRTFLFFDTETTGLPKNWKASYKDINNWPRLVQVAWIVGDENGNVIKKKDYIIKPEGFEIPIGASNVHRISTKKALQNGYELQFVLNKFNKDLAETNYLVAHNISFDINILASEMFRLDLDSEIFEKQQICTMESTVDFCKLPGNYGYKYPKLSELHQKLFQTGFDEAHDASVDIKATYKCFYKLLDINAINL